MNAGPFSKNSRIPRGQTRIAANKDFSSKYVLSVPATIARLIGPDRVFQAELTEEGILYRYVSGGEPVVLPDWLRNG